MSVSPPGPPLKITCPSCGAKASAPATVVGRSVRCGRCQASFRVPDGRGAAPGPSAVVPAPTQAEAPPAPRPTIAEAVATPPASETEWNVGDVVLGLYEVTDVLGQGGMGRVYRVRHRGWDVDLAVKAPLPPKASPNKACAVGS